MKNATEMLRRDFKPAEAFSYAGDRFMLGYGNDFYGIYDKYERRDPPEEPVAVFPLTEQGWQEAWQLFSLWEPKSHPVSLKHSPQREPSPGSAPDPLVTGFAERRSYDPNQEIVPLKIKSVHFGERNQKTKGLLAKKTLRRIKRKAFFALRGLREKNLSAELKGILSAGSKKKDS